MKNRNIWIGILLLTSIILMGTSGCVQEINSTQIITCDKPNILVGTECCLDQNDNSICDKNEETKQTAKIETPKKVALFFYESKINCSLDGKIYVDDTLLGETKEGYFILTEEDYLEKFRVDSRLSIMGITGSCFKENSNLPFTEYYEPYDFQYLFDNNENLTFELSLDPRNPRYYSEIQGFIRPQETESYLNTLRGDFKNDTEEDLDRIVRYMRLSYISDNALFKKQEYWQTPAETLRRRMGDCEDWATATLSLMRQYDKSIRCYNTLWQTHVSVFCYFKNQFIIYDQDKVKFKTTLDTKNFNTDIVQQENKVEIRSMRNRYFEEYGISPDERKLNAVFNEEELVVFEEDEDFVNWALNLMINP